MLIKFLCRFIFILILILIIIIIIFIFAPTWNETFDLPDGSYSISDIQDYFEFFIKKHETLTENP